MYAATGFGKLISKPMICKQIGTSDFIICSEPHKNKVFLPSSTKRFTVSISLETTSTNEIIISGLKRQSIKYIIVLLAKK